VRIQAPFQVEMPFGVIAAGGTRDLSHLRQAGRGRRDIVRLNQEAGHAVHDCLGQSAAPERDDRSPARLRVSSGNAERLVPPCRAHHHGRASHHRPH